MDDWGWVENAKGSQFFFIVLPHAIPIDVCLGRVQGTRQLTKGPVAGMGLSSGACWLARDLLRKFEHKEAEADDDGYRELDIHYCAYPSPSE
jgi:hypothetical protein